MLEKFKDETFLSRWANDELSPEELMEFKKHPDYDNYIKIIAATDTLLLRDYDVENALSKIKSRSNHLDSSPKITKPIRKLWPYISVAASILLIIGLFIFNNKTIKHTTNYGETKTVVLPDGSEMILNAKSFATYDKDWNNDRIVNLIGEAYFKVRKGSEFSVKTTNGVVTVLGTQFNVESQNEMFEVVCYEGKVSVKTNDNKHILTPGKAFRSIANTLNKKWDENINEPTWIHNSSSFQSVPLKYVLEELEEQYNLTINNKTLDLTIIYTGTFPNDNINVALKTVFSTLDVNYVLSNDGKILDIK